MSLAELTEAFEAKLVYDWDHTSHILSMLYSQIVANAGKGSPKPASYFHPWRRSKKENQITKKNFKVLKMLGDALCRGKSR